MNSNKYELDFYEAMKMAMANECWLQGEDFKAGVVMCFGKSGMGRINVDCLSAYDFNTGCSWPIEITGTIIKQKFRVVSTQPDAMKK